VLATFAAFDLLLLQSACKSFASFRPVQRDDEHGRGEHVARQSKHCLLLPGFKRVGNRPMLKLRASERFRSRPELVVVAAAVIAVELCRIAPAHDYDQRGGLPVTLTFPSVHPVAR
jgi:hypothetical protein